MKKVCSLCKEFKDLNEFHNDKSFKSGKYSRCKTCKILQSGNWNKLNSERHNKNKNKSTLNRLSKGLCKGCIKERLPNHNSFCEYHYIKSLAHCHFKMSTLDYNNITIQLKEKLISQNYICPYTGETLILGLNAHLEHILPVSRFPEYRYDLDNLEWVIKEVNQAKYNLTKDEFIIMCKRIISYMSDKI